MSNNNNGNNNNSNNKNNVNNKNNNKYNGSKPGQEFVECLNNYTNKKIGLDELYQKIYEITKKQMRIANKKQRGKNKPHHPQYDEDEFYNNSYYYPQQYIPFYGYPHTNYQPLQYYLQPIIGTNLVMQPGNLGDTRDAGNTGNITIDASEYDALIKECLSSYQYEKCPLPSPVAVSAPKKINVAIKGNKLCHLLDIVNNYEYDEKCIYNIDMKALTSIKAELNLLNSMIGIQGLKDSICQQLIYFIQKLHITMAIGEGDKVEGTSNMMQEYKHTVLYGPPGTGKTEVAKIIGAIYSKIGVLSKNVFKKVTRSDLISGYLGQTAIKTNGVINDCVGGVLFIDEAYSLGGVEKDSYAKECVDTLCEALSNHRDDLMVIVAGYEQDMNELFFTANKGLDSRFIWRFKIEGYSHNELADIFIKKVNESTWKLQVGVEPLYKWFSKNKAAFENFGRDVELLLTYTKISHSSRVFGLDCDYLRKITMEDIDNGLVMFYRNKKEKKQNKVIEGLYI